MLRGRATRKQLKDGASQEKALVPVDDKPQHLNLFADIEEKVSGILYKVMVYEKIYNKFCDKQNW